MNYWESFNSKKTTSRHTSRQNFANAMAPYTSLLVLQELSIPIILLPNFSLLKTYVTWWPIQLAHPQLMLYDANRCNKHEIIYCRIVIALWMTKCMQEYKNMLIPKEVILCVNMGWEYHWYTPYFGTIYPYIWSFMIIYVNCTFNLRLIEIYI